VPARLALFILLGVFAAAGATLGLAHALSGHALLNLAPGAAARSAFGGAGAAARPPALAMAPAPARRGRARRLQEGRAVPALAPLTPPCPNAPAKAPSPERVLVLACGALAREIGAVAAANGWGHLDLICLPAIWHNTPEKIVPGLRDLLATRHGGQGRVFIAYADCGTGGAVAALAREIGAEMLPGPHCYAVFQAGLEEAFPAPEADMRAFYLTDFLVRQFDAFVWRPLGLDRHPGLRDTYFGAYERLVHLAQTEDPALEEAARACAARLGLAFEHRPTGLGGLAEAMGPAGAPMPPPACPPA